MTTVRSTAGRIVCPRTDLEGTDQSSCASLAGPRLELSGQKIVGDGQLPDFGVKILNLFLINFWRFPAAAFEHARRAFKQSAFPLMDHRWMDAKSTGQLADRLLALQRLQPR